MSKFGFSQTAAIIRRKEPVILREIANMSRNHYLNAFQKSSWEGKTWRQVQRKIPGTPTYKYPKKKGLSRRTKPILVNRGTLRRAVNSSVKGISGGKIYFRVDLPYAKRHNEGLKGMPKRQFMGWSNEQSKKAKEIIERNINRSFNR